MTPDKVIEWAREAGFEVHERKQQARVGIDALIGIDSTEKLTRFAQLARADKQEQCAKVVREQKLFSWTDLENYGEKFCDAFNAGISAADDTIRALKD